MMPFTPQSVSELVEYFPSSGEFRWKVSRNSFGGKAKPGAVAGTPKDGYILVGVLGRQVRAHRLAWFVTTGEWPPKGLEIDHINGDRSDNRWVNLRLVSRSQNNMNARTRPDSLSGRRGVYCRKDTGAWHARITVGGRVILLGQFATFEEAASVRTSAEIEHFGAYNRGTP